MISQPLVRNARFAGQGAVKATSPFNSVTQGEKKCTYVQMKGGPLLTGECQKGGMACEKECDLGEAEGECRMVEEEVCQQVVKPHCKMVMESVCEPVTERVCEDTPKNREPQIR